MERCPSIYVLVCTINEGIRKVSRVLLPPEAGVRYVVSWQQTKVCEACPEALQRDDVTITTLQGRGLSRNRNHAMQVAVSLFSDMMEDVVFVIADDDERLEATAFSKIRDLYARYPRLDGALWRMADLEDGHLLKEYPASVTDYRHCPRNCYPSSVEMTFRSRLYVMGLRFDERFGLGSERLAAGEEEVFLADALRRGLRIWMYPQVLCFTVAQTTGLRVLDVKVLRSKGAVYAYNHSILWAFFRSVREALSLAFRHRYPFSPIFRNIWYGVKYIRS